MLATQVPHRIRASTSSARTENSNSIVPATPVVRGIALAVTLAVQMRAGQQIHQFGEAVDEMLKTIQHSLPEDLILARTSDQPRQVEENVDLFTHASDGNRAHPSPRSFPHHQRAGIPRVGSAAFGGVEGSGASAHYLRQNASPGYTMMIGGNRAKQEAEFKELTLVLVMSAALIFLALVSQFNNAVKPILVFAAVPYLRPLSHTSVQ